MRLVRYSDTSGANDWMDGVSACERVTSVTKLLVREEFTATAGMIDAFRAIVETLTAAMARLNTSTVARMSSTSGKESTFASAPSSCSSKWCKSTASVNVCECQRARTDYRYNTCHLLHLWGGSTAQTVFSAVMALVTGLDTTPMMNSEIGSATDVNCITVMQHKYTHKL